LKREQQSNLNDAITRRTQEEVFAIARKTLTDLAGTSLEERMARCSRAACESWTMRRKKVSPRP
jgi:hypothetical protein